MQRESSDPAKLIGAVLLLFTGWNRLQGEHFAPHMRSHGYPVRDRVALQLLQRILITLFQRQCQIIALLISG